MTTLPFSEGINQVDRRIITTVSNSMDTSAVDPFRQGVELTLDKHFQQGIAKIWSGIDGHTISMIEIGQRDDDIFPEQTFYEEVSKFNPVVYLTNGYVNEAVVVDSAVNVNEVGFDGIIEPFPLRRVITFTSIDVPFEARSVKANLESGNHDPFRNADQVVSKYRFSEASLGSAPYEDNTDMAGLVPTNLGFWPTISTRLAGFEDSQVKDGVILPVVAASDFKERLKGMAPPTHNHLALDNVSTAASMHSLDDYRYAKKTNILDPSKLELTGWWRTEYSGIPWRGVVSTGNSHVHSLAAGTAASTGTTLNGRTVASFSSAGSQYLTDTSISSLAYVSTASYSVILLARPTAASAPAGNVYDNQTLVGDQSTNYGIVYSTSGVKGYHYSSPTYYETEWISCDTGAWHFFALVYDGRTLNLYMDRRRTTYSPADGSALPNMSTPSFFSVARSSMSTYADVDVAEVMVSKAAYTWNDFEPLIERYFNLRYALAL